ncbi:hypothetical protein [Dactylosporangium sp. NPDC048998]|uniref:hypothetical protein n=1 Tax=Dactylosporangium sp. NPDC048998 TaxID=3363976 RepID=UPI00371633C4
MTSPTPGTPLPVRSLEEGYEFASMQPCDCGVAAEPAADLAVTELGPGSYRLGFSCRECAGPRELLVVLTERPNLPGEEFAYSRSGRPSKIIDAGGWTAVLHRYYTASMSAIDLLDGEPPDDVLAPVLARSLVRAAAAAEEALALLPEGADALPEEQVSTAAGRALRTKRPSLFTREVMQAGPDRCREQLTEAMAAYQNSLGCLGTRLENLMGEVLPYGTRHIGEPFNARTYWEAKYHSKTVDCRCGSNRVETTRSELLIEGQLLTRLFGSCEACGRPREFFYRNLADPAAELPMDEAWGLDARASQLFDPAMLAGFAAALEGIARANIAADPSGQWYGIRHLLTMVIAGFDEAYDALPPGADRIPAEALWHPTGQAQAAEHPESLERGWLEWARRQARDLLADFLARYPRPEQPDDDAGPLSPRSGIERSLYIALHPCECGEPVFEPDEMVVETVDVEPIARHRGPCGACGRQRQFEFALSEQTHPPDALASWAGPHSASAIIDAGQWLRVSDDLQAAAEVMARGGVDGAELGLWGQIASGAAPEELLWGLLARSASAVDEALKFLRPGRDELPGEAFWTEDGRRLRDERPERLTRRALEALRDERRARVPLPAG